MKRFYWMPLAMIAVALLSPTRARADQFVLFDVTFTYTKNDADNSTPSKSHYYVTGTAINPQRPRDWTSPVDYRNGTVHIRTEVLDRPASGEATQWSLCYIPNKGQGNGYGCTNTDAYKDKGVYEKDVSMRSFWENDAILWNEGIKQMDLVIKDKDGNKIHTRPDAEKFVPTRVRITMVQVSAGAKYDPALVSSIPPTKPLGRKKELLFRDDFDGTNRDARWHKVVDTFAFENGALKGTQTREKDTPSADGKSVVTAHAAVYGLNLPTRDSIVETKIRFDGASMIDVEFDDRAFTGSHYGHLCRAQVRLDRVTILDERDGSQSNALIELRKDPEKNKAAISELQKAHRADFPVQLETGKWYTLVVETVGDSMRVLIDGAPVAYLKSPGIGHATKSKIELGVGGKDGWFDDIRVWNAEPVP